MEDQRSLYDKLVESHEDTYRTALSELETFAPVDICHHTIQHDPLTFAMKEQESMEENAHLYLIKRGSCMKSKLLRRADQLMVDDPEHMPHLEELEQIKEDIGTLDKEHFLAYHKLVNDHREKNNRDWLDLEDVMPHRNQHLEVLLHTYVMEHGYTTGMHIIASLLLFCIEMDLAYTKPCWKRFLDRKFLLHDTYAIFTKVIRNMESKAEHIQPHQMLQHVSRDKSTDRLKQFILQPTKVNNHEKIFNKWMSSLFATQVKGWRNVFQLWDIFFDLVTIEPSLTSMDANRYTRPGAPSKIRLGAFDLVEVMRISSASLIWLNREQCIQKGACFGVLVNVEPLENVTGLMATLLASARRYQIARDDPMAAQMTAIRPPVRKSSLNKQGAPRRSSFASIEDENNNRNGSSLDDSFGLDQVPVFVPLEPQQSSGLIGRYRLDTHRQTSMVKMMNIGQTSMSNLIHDDVHSSDDDDEIPLNDADQNMMMSDESTEAIRESLRPSSKTDKAGRRRSSLLLGGLLRKNSKLTATTNNDSIASGDINNAFENDEEDIIKLNDDSGGSLDLDFPHAIEEKKLEKVEQVKTGFQKFRRRFSRDYDDFGEEAAPKETDKPLNDASLGKEGRRSSPGGRFSRFRKRFSRDDDDKSEPEPVEAEDDADFLRNDYDPTGASKRPSGTSVDMAMGKRPSGTLMDFVYQRRYSFETDDGDEDFQSNGLDEDFLGGDQELMDMKNNE